VLGSFVAKGWLLKSPRGRYSLSVRTLMELNTYLKETYPDEYTECTICMESLTRGVACITTNCKTRLHQHCFKKFRQRTPICPSCQKDWPEDIKLMVPIGEEAMKDGQDEGRRIRRKSTAEDSDEEEEEEEEEEDEPSQPASTQKKARVNKKQPLQVSDDDEDDEEEVEEAPTRRRGKA